jgi:hypothetical protein
VLQTPRSILIFSLSRSLQRAAEHTSNSTLDVGLDFMTGKLLCRNKYCPHVIKRFAEYFFDGLVDSDFLVPSPLPDGLDVSLFTYNQQQREHRHWQIPAHLQLH